jgi:putative solute:sodium symporter small subunit
MQEYWKKNIRKVLSLLGIWFLVSYVFGILLVDQLNAVQIGGFKLGFWFAQQGSIYTFVILIWVYVRQMNKLDTEYGVNE